MDAYTILLAFIVGGLTLLPLVCGDRRGHDYYEEEG